MATYPKSTNDQLPATDWNIVAGQADTALQPSGNLSGLADLVTAWRNLALPFDAADDAGIGFIFVDAGYTVIATLDGTTLSYEGIIDATTVDLRGGELWSDDEGLLIVDAGYTVIGTIGAAGLAMDLASSYRTLTVTTLADITGQQFEAADGASGVAIVDAGYTAIGLFDTASPDAAEAVPTHAATEITARDNGNRASAAAMAVEVVSNIARPIWGRSHFLSYGQSLSIASEGTPVLSTTAKYGNLMFGDRIRPTTNNSATATWDRVGASAFNNMVTTGDAEVPICAALNTFRRQWLAQRQEASNANIAFVASSAGIGGQPISALQQGASPDIFNRLVSCMSQANSQATTDSKTYGIGALLYIQGESDQTVSEATYRTALNDIVTDFQAAAIAQSGQADVPPVFIYQTAAPNTNFDTANLGVQMAQLNKALEDATVFMVGPNYPYPDSNNLHLPANSYRWMGSQFGKVMHRVLSLGHRWKPTHIRRATRRGYQILLDFHVPSPPLVFEDPWLQTGWFVGETTTGGANSQYAAADKGFTVRDTTNSATITIASVALASATQVLITLARIPPSAATVVVRYADGAHFGHGSVRDSDPTLADDSWTHTGGQTSADTNATLVGARHRLYNWAVAQQITVETL
jgi:hypothetical protein